MNLDLSYGNYIFARITKCRVFGPVKTFTGVELTFDLQIEPTSKVTGKNPRLDALTVDLYLIKNSQDMNLGRLKSRSIDSSSINYSHEHQLLLLLTTDAFLKLVDETHFGDLEMRLRAQALLRLDEEVKNSSGGPLTDLNPTYLSGEARIVFPHSDWLKIINNAKLEFFDLITLRTNLQNLPEPVSFVHAFKKLREAQDKFNRGDWNAVGAACRSAIRTVMSLKQGEKKPINSLLASVIDDPERKRFASSVMAVWDTLNTATHLEGNHNEDLPPADFRREDAMLTLHLTAAAISYIAAVYK